MPTAEIKKYQRKYGNSIDKFCSFSLDGVVIAQFLIEKDIYLRTNFLDEIMNILEKIIPILFLTTSSSVFSANYVGLQCGFNFDGGFWKNSFIINMEGGLSEYEFTNKEGEKKLVTNLETIVAPSQITIIQPTQFVNITHRISRDTLSYQRNRTNGPLAEELGTDLSGTEFGECEIVEIDTSSNQF